MKATMRTIAHTLGISVASVSLALRNSPQISVALREQVRETAERLGYRTNPMMAAWMAERRSMLQPKSEIIAYLNGFKDQRIWSAWPTNTRFLKGARQRAHQLGYEIEEFQLHASGMTQQRMSRVLHARGIRGVIIGSHDEPNVALELEWNHFCCAAQAFSTMSPVLHRTANNFAHTTRLALHELQHLGYRRIGMAVPVAVDERARQAWSSSYLGYFQNSQHLPILWMEHNVQLVKQWMEVAKPDAIVTLTYELGQYLPELGYRVPEDVALVHLDLHPQKYKNWAGVDHHIENAGSGAVDLVAEQLIHNSLGIPPVSKILLTEGTWVGGQTAPPRYPAEK
jgi:LacI family transcriptional regulator